MSATPREKALEVLPTGTVTFVFTDIEGSTQRWDRNRAAMEQAVRRHDEMLRAAITGHGGHVFKTVGDAFCAAFAKPESAVHAALDAQRALGEEDFSTVGGLRVRMAINTGTADERDGDYFGPTLNRVARLLSLAHGGQVLLAGIAADLARENPPPESTLEDLGAHELKDLERHERVYQLVAPGLQRDFPGLRSGKAPWLVPEALRTRYFTGRDDLLDLLHRQLQERHRVALSGLGGVGKTQTAAEYAFRHRPSYPDGVFWVNAESIEGLTAGFVEIAKTLRLPEADSNNQEQTIAAVLHWMHDRTSWLLVLDNVENRKDLQRFVTDRHKGNVIVTSRQSVFPEFGILRSLEVLDLADSDAVRFLLLRTGREEDDQERTAAAQLASELGNLPLALEQAAAYIVETGVSFAGYLEAFHKRRLALLEKARDFIDRDTVAVTWAANFEAIERSSRAAAEVLRVGALLAPDAIPYEVFGDGAALLGESISEALSDPDDMSMAELLRPLSRYSLIRVDAQARTFSMHRLVREIVRSSIPEAQREGYAERAVNALDAAFPTSGFENWGTCERLVAHVGPVTELIESYAIRSAASGSLLHRAGAYLWERGRYGEARPVHQRALEIREGLYGPQSPQIADSLHFLGLTYHSQGNFEEAESFYQRSLAIREQALGPDHPDVAKNLSNLGALAEHRGRYMEARPLFERALAIRERALGPDHPDVAFSLTNIAATMEREGRFAEATRLEERALKIFKASYGSGHPRVAWSLGRLATARQYEGRYADEQALREQVAAIQERTMGADHPELARTLDSLGQVQLRRGEGAEALRTSERALTIAERALGPDNPQLAGILDGLGTAYTRAGRGAEALAVHQRALAINERYRGPEDRVVAHSLSCLGAALDSQSRFAEAQSAYERALAIYEHAATEDSNVNESLVGLAEIFAKAGRPAEAEPLYRRSLEVLEGALGVEHPELVDSLLGLARIRKDQGRSAESIELFERALRLREIVYTRNHPELEELRSIIEALRTKTGSPPR